MISLQACKISDGSYNKAANDLKFKVLSRNKPKNMAVHVENIGPQQDSVRRVLKIILPQFYKDLYGIERRLVPILSCKKDKNMAARLKHIAIKHSQMSSNIKTHEIKGINSIDNPIFPGSELILRKIIIDIKTEYGERLAITITRNWRGALEMWVKKKHKKHASVVANHLPAWLCKLHSDKVLTLFSIEDQS